MKYVKIIIICIFIFGLTACIFKEGEQTSDVQDIKKSNKELLEAYVKEEEVTLGIMDTNEKIERNANEYEHTTGIISGYIGDLDNDKEDELLLLYKDTNNLLNMIIYEVVDEKIEKGAEFNETQIFNVSSEEIVQRYTVGKEITFYLNEYNDRMYIMVEMATYIDGGDIAIGAFLYDGKNINNKGDLVYEFGFPRSLFYSMNLPENWEEYHNNEIINHSFLNEDNGIKTSLIFAEYQISEEQEKNYYHYFSNKEEVIMSYYNNFGIKRKSIFNSEEQEKNRQYTLDYEKSKDIIKLAEFYKTYGDNNSSKWTRFTKIGALTE